MAEFNALMEKLIDEAKAEKLRFWRIIQVPGGALSTK
jgi:hypothetical protein